jgi:hypothetical protein
VRLAAPGCRYETVHWATLWFAGGVNVAAMCVGPVIVDPSAGSSAASAAVGGPPACTSIATRAGTDKRP